MTLAPNFIDDANLITDDNGNLITSQFTSSEMIEEIKAINEYYKQEYETDEEANGFKRTLMIKLNNPKW